MSSGTSVGAEDVATGETGAGGATFGSFGRMGATDGLAATCGAASCISSAKASRKALLFFSVLLPLAASWSVFFFKSLSETGTGIRVRAGAGEAKGTEAGLGGTDTAFDSAGGVGMVAA